VVVPSAGACSSARAPTTPHPSVARNAITIIARMSNLLPRALPDRTRTPQGVCHGLLGEKLRELQTPPRRAAQTPGTARPKNWLGGAARDEDATAQREDALAALVHGARLDV